MIGVSEASNLAIRLGLEPEMIAKVINSSSGRCWSSDTYNPCPGIIEGIPSSNNYQGGFASQLMAKVSHSIPYLLASWFWKDQISGHLRIMVLIVLIVTEYETTQGRNFGLPLHLTLLLGLEFSISKVS